MMGEQNQPNALETQWAFLESTNDTYYLANHEFNKQYMPGIGMDGIHYVPVSTPHDEWIHYQQTPQEDYVAFLAENDVSEVQADASAEASGFGLPDGSADLIDQEIRYLRPYFEEVLLNNLMGLNNQKTCISAPQKEEPRRDVRHVPRPRSEVSVAGSSHPPKRVNISKEKAAVTDRRRRMRIAERLEALGASIPHSKQAGKASTLEEIIDHIRYLQFQIKDLSMSRLGGEPSSMPCVFLEGYGHYALDEQLSESLEEMMGRLLEVNPSMATQLLENKGLFVMPMALAEGSPQLE